MRILQGGHRGRCRISVLPNDKGIAWFDLFCWHFCAYIWMCFILPLFTYFLCIYYFFFLALVRAGYPIPCYFYIVHIRQMITVHTSSTHCAVLRLRFLKTPLKSKLINHVYYIIYRYSAIQSL